MTRKHLKLIKKLNRLFLLTNEHQKGGELIREQEGIELTKPGLAFFTDEQIQNETNEPIPEFCIEIISPNDQIKDVKKKIREYFKNGVRVVWVVLPEVEMVEVYTSVKDMKICMEQDICSALPVLDDFQISVEELLA